MTTIDTDAIAADLLAAYATGKTLDPLTTTYPSISVDDSYAIQQRQTESRLRAGARVVGFKIGLTSLAMQQQLGVDQPDYGHLFADMVYAADSPIATSGFLQPRAEPEIALVLGKALRGPGLSVADIASATAYVLPAIEIIDSRITDWKIKLEDTIADNASSGGIVMGSTPIALQGLDLSMLGCVLRRNGRMVQNGAGAAVMGSPLTAATWLANTLTARGVELGVGHIILTGSITAAVPVQAGDTITATIDQLGSVTAVFD
ncbi:fumarylacetoacetate hydrolase family protein [Acidothermaceae bacterium B102]|nr:fumarylacetoacetate hydrolase family protein [Acidothermaceae bacterium B102]